MAEPIVTLAFVASLNGKTTDGDSPDVHTWNSDEDTQHFHELRDRSDVIIVGRNTYEAMQLQPQPGKLRVVFTSTPQKFHDRQVGGQLEFTNETPAALLNRLGVSGYQKVLLAAGANLSSQFLEAGLVDGLYVSIEPLLLASGRPLFEGIQNVQLELQSVSQLNTRGTLLVHYAVRKASRRI